MGIIIAGNCMFPTSKRTISRKAFECLGASLDAASTVTVDQRGGVKGETKEEIGDQCRVVVGTGSGDAA